MSQISNGVLSDKPLADWTDEEKNEWDQYAQRLAYQIAYNEFRGVPSVRFYSFMEWSDFIGRIKKQPSYD